MKNTESNSRPRWSLTNITNSIEGDKVIWIIVLLLTMISILTIFSSTTLLAKDETRVDIIKTHSIIADREGYTVDSPEGGSVTFAVYWKYIDMAQKFMADRLCGEGL